MGYRLIVFIVCFSGVGNIANSQQNQSCKLPPNCPAKTQKYLTDYGYMDPNKPCELDDIQAALRKFQELNINFEGIEITGECDNNTVRVMGMRRCGCEDIVKMEKKMMPQNIYGPLEYNVGNSKWTERRLTWKVTKYPIKTKLTNAQVDDAMKRAFQLWADQTTLSFEQRGPSANTDIDIRFEVKRHNRGPPFFDFDGPGNVLAHAFFPKSGVVHFDDEEEFVLNSDRSTELYIVAAHEFGHTLGISHSNNKDALMAPYYRYEDPLTLHEDDIAAVQYMYGKSNRQPPTRATTRPTPRPTPRPTAAPTRWPVPTSSPSDRSEFCDLKIKATFKMGIYTYVFTQANWYSPVYVYKVNKYRGLLKDSKQPISSLFKKKSPGRYPRAYPHGVDAAAYVPHKGYVFLFRGTKAYRYKEERGKFYLEENAGFPRWMNVREFPERPRAAVAFPYSNHNSYYMLIFGSTMVWDWNFFSQRVGAWAYPISVFGRRMPQRVDSAYLDENGGNAIFLQNTKFYEFSLRYRRVLGESNIKNISEELLRIKC